MRKFQEEPRKAELALKAFSFSFDQILQQGENSIFREMSLCEPQHCQTKTDHCQDPFLGPTEDYFGNCHFAGL